MEDLFSATVAARPRPLAALLRPTRLADILGQEHLTRPDSLLQSRIKSGRLGSVILFGPSGTGKTTLARIAGQMMGKVFTEIHAVNNSTADIRAAIQHSRTHDLLVFVDEIHAFGRTGQQFLLKSAEEGQFDLIMATTRNPYHDVDSALVSRSTILQFHAVPLEAMVQVTQGSVAYLQSVGIDLGISADQIKLIAGRSSGDARRAVSAIENLSAGLKRGDHRTVTDEHIAEIYQAAPIGFDRTGDYHYDVISAFIKSMRGSDPDATLYWLARLIHSGEDPRYIARRIMIHASEDVGLADNSALQTATAAATAVAHIGYPEAQIILAHAALHVARSPKSNSVARGIGSALAYVQSKAAIPVPLHLRDQHYSGAKKLGYEGYLFPHDYSLGWVDQVYAPGILPSRFYESDARPDLASNLGQPSFEEEADKRRQFIEANKNNRFD